uniref:Melan-A n=1 Tax=Mus musculus TaxID=10090 RepID=A0A494BBN3_MOUSE
MPQEDIHFGYPRKGHRRSYVTAEESGQVPSAKNDKLETRRCFPGSRKGRRLVAVSSKSGTMFLSSVGHAYLLVQGRRDRHPDRGPGDCSAYRLLVL